MKTFTVFGIYADNMQRHSNHVDANNPDQAERKYRSRMSHAGHDMLVAAVLEGQHSAVDKSDDARQAAS